MKHGGYKDLIELVSLAKIEREVRVRGDWRVDGLVRRRDEVLRLIKGGAEVGDLKNFESDEYKSVGTNNVDFAVIDHNEAEGPLSSHSDIPTTVNGNSNGSKWSIKQYKPPLMHKMTQKVRKLLKLTSHPTTQQQQYLDKLNSQIIQINQAMTSIQERIPRFKMIYISPMHLREREAELVNSGFRAMKRRNAFKSVKKISASDVKTLNKLLEEEEEDEDKVVEKLESSVNVGRSMRRTSRVVTRQTSILGRKGRNIHLFGADNVKMSKFDVENDHVDVCFGGCFNYKKDEGSFNEEDEYCHDESSHDESSKQPQQPHDYHTTTDESDGYATLMTFVHQLKEQQKENDWKVTLAQQTIGTTFENGDINKPKSAKTASSLLYEGKLQGRLLHHLIDEEIKMIRNMQLLTMPKEANVVEQVRNEYDDILKRQRRGKGEEVSAKDVSNLMNDFVGKAIHKNFDPEHGRFVMLRQFGRDLRENKVHLTEEEFVPAMHLENLFCSHFSDDDYEFYVGDIRKVAGETFSLLTKDVPGPSDTIEEGAVNKVIDRGGSSLSETVRHRRSICEHPIFASGLSQWQSLLELSLSMKHPNATNRVWTCGLTDGGLHNLFLGEDQMWAFDLGEPSLEPIPAFLTKFLMSFFHALGEFACLLNASLDYLVCILPNIYLNSICLMNIGMEEDEKGDWVVRFEQAEGKLRPTETTKKLFPQIVHSFNITVDRLIKELFDGEEEVRTLLHRYVVTQLISDAAFCIEKWKTKGGGDESRSDHQTHLEKWLWRALWDVYASEEIRRLYLTRLIMKKQPGRRDLFSEGSI